MKTNLNNLSNATLINIINDLNAHIYHSELLQVHTESYTTELLEQVDRLTNELFLLEVDYNDVVRELTRIENDNNIYGVNHEEHNEDCPEWQKEGIFTEEIDWDTQTELPDVFAIKEDVYSNTDDFYCTCCGKYRVGQAWHIDRLGRPYCKTCFESVPF